jgi:hypothetical protein
MRKTIIKDDSVEFEAEDQWNNSSLYVALEENGELHIGLECELDCVSITLTKEEIEVLRNFLKTV